MMTSSYPPLEKDMENPIRLKIQLGLGLGLWLGLGLHEFLL